MEAYILGMDIGTGSIKAVAVNEQGNVLHTAQAHYSTLQPQPGYNEQDPEVVWQAFVSCTKEVITTTNQQPIAICLSSAMHGVIPVEESGHALSNMITWADTRSADIAEQMKNSKEAVTIYKTTGTPVHSMSPLFKIIWIKENEPELFSKTHKFIGIKEYIWFKLFAQFQVDYSIASATGLFDIEQKKWSEEAINFAGISAAQLSEPVATEYQTNGLNAAAAAQLSISANTTFVIGASDGCFANLGSFAITPNIAALTIGTSGAVRIASHQPIADFSSMIFNYILDKEWFICGGPVNNGGNTIDWALNCFLNNTTHGVDYKQLFEIITSVPAGSDGLLFLPYINGERAPIWDAKSCGVFFGVRPQHTQAYFLRAIVEGVCYALNDILQQVEKLSAPIEQINASGGFIHSPVWLQIMADITGKKISIVQTEDASAVGAAYFALRQLNMVTDYTAFFKSTDQFIEPNRQNHESYQRYFSLFKKLYSNVKETMHELYRINQ